MHLYIIPKTKIVLETMNLLYINKVLKNCYYKLLNILITHKKYKLR